MQLRIISCKENLTQLTPQGNQSKNLTLTLDSLAPPFQAKNHSAKPNFLNRISSKIQYNTLKYLTCKKKHLEFSSRGNLIKSTIGLKAPEFNVDNRIKTWS